MHCPSMNTGSKLHRYKRPCRLNSAPPASFNPCMEDAFFTRSNSSMKMDMDFSFRDTR